MGMTISQLQVKALSHADYLSNKLNISAQSGISFMTGQLRDCLLLVTTRWSNGRTESHYSNAALLHIYDMLSCQNLNNVFTT